MIVSQPLQADSRVKGEAVCTYLLWLLSPVVCVVWDVQALLGRYDRHGMCGDTGDPC